MGGKLSSLLGYRRPSSASVRCWTYLKDNYFGLWFLRSCGCSGRGLSISCHHHECKRCDTPNSRRWHLGCKHCSFNV